MGPRQRVLLGPFRRDRFDAFLKRNLDRKADCLFVVMPDAVGDARETHRLWAQYAPSYAGWPRAFVAQDGQEELPFPEGFDVLFIGGSSAWKDGPGAVRCVEWAVAHGKRVHVGRVNTWRRFRKFADLAGSEEFTCDGTKQRFIGRDRALAHYQGLEDAWNHQPRFDLFGGDSAS